MTGPTFRGGPNVAVKIPRADYERTVAFYRDTLRFEVEEVDVSDAPTVSRSHRLSFGEATLWLDQVDTYSRPDVWLELRTDDLDAAVGRLAGAGVHPRDELEPLETSTRSHWIRDPAGTVHLLVEDAPPDR